MNAEHLKTILNEYPPSMRLVLIVDGTTMWETVVLEAVLRLTHEPQSTLRAFFVRDSCIIRERGEFTGDVAGAPPYRKWLEIDLR